jgi:thymidylate synthase
MSTIPVIIEVDNLSVAWRSILEKLVESKNGEISPLVLSLTDFKETANIRSALDKHLEIHRMPRIETVAETIFPDSIYEYSGYDRTELYRIYKKNLIRVKKISSSNRNGTYFSRLIAYGDENNPINQLEIIITALNGKRSPRRSKLQAGIFDPSTDHTNSAMQGFPCLQHVTFVKTKDGGLILNSFYAIQFFYKRAYGNWLGLINLGKFIAKESGLKFERFNCFIGAETLDNITKSEAKKLLEITHI